MASFSAPCGAGTFFVAPMPNDDEFQERAAILEYDGGYPRAEAEQRAHTELNGRRDQSWLQ
ncbi:MAG TPA: hypothetical protein VFA12_09510 [Stellaceae bacterium]|nr:hypothetical protein [Stellaceae bacterium]